MTTLPRKFSNLTINKLLKRKNFLEVTVFVLTILLAGFLGNYIALLATKQITDMLTRFIVGIFIGLLVGTTVGILIKRTWEKIRSYFPQVQSQ